MTILQYGKENGKNSVIIEAMLWDLTLPLDESTPPFPGDPALERKYLMDYRRGDEMQLSTVSFSTHLGTHVDAPLHIFPNGKGVDQLDLGMLCGPAVVVEILTEEGISADMIRRHGLPKSGRILFKTRHGGALYPRPTAWLEPEAAAFLVQQDICLVGIDSASVDRAQDPTLPSHRLLLRKEVIIVENLVLHEVVPGPAELICLPLKLVGGDGAPARVVLQSAG